MNGSQRRATQRYALSVIVGSGKKKSVDMQERKILDKKILYYVIDLTK